MKKVLLGGAGGLIGTHLREVFGHLGWEAVSLTRGPGGPGLVRWDPMSGLIDPEGIDGCDCVINLAGENIATGRWTKERKRLILESREEGTRLLAQALAHLAKPPSVMICASGSGYYRDNEGGPPWDESGPAGSSFISEVCVKWEAAADPAREAGIRVIHARMGPVLSAQGGLLTRMLPAICSGLGGYIGSGTQRISWIHIDDLVRAYVLMVQRTDLSGPVNVASPNPVSNRDFINAVARAIHRPCFMKMPRTAVLWLYGEMGADMLLADNAVAPGKLMHGAMQWEFPKIDEALADLLENIDCWK
jgi:uncharacterized protein